MENRIVPVFKKSSANGEKVSPLWGSASVAALESVGFASASVAADSRSKGPSAERC